MTSKGAISVSRQILSSGIWRKPSDWVRIWLFLLLAVSYQSDPAGVHKRGGALFSWRLCRNNLPGISKQTWQRALVWLQAENMIILKKVRSGALIFVVNYDLYQPVKSLQESSAPHEVPAKIEWVEPFREAWHAAYGGELSLGVALKVLKPLLAKNPSPDVLSRLQTYCAKTSGAHASLPHFAATFGTWSPMETGPDPLTGAN